MKKSTWFGALLGCAVGLVIGLPAKADSLTLGFHTVSYHTSGNYNNTNPGVYVEYDGWTAGTYYNSERKQTYYAGYTFAGKLVGPLDWGLSVGVATGYSRSPVVPMLVPSVRLGVGEHAAVRVSAVPPLAGSAGVVHLSVEYLF